MGRILHGRVDLKGLIVNSTEISLWKIWASFTRGDPGDAIWAASTVTLFGAATSGGKKADKRLLFGTESETPGTASRILNWDLKPIVQHIAPGINFLCVCRSFGHFQNTLGHF